MASLGITPAAFPLWLDLDTGHDDALALLLAAFSPSLRLLGVSTIYGNAPLSHTTYNTRAVLKAIGQEATVPVYPGASKPFCRRPASALDIHGKTGLDGTTCLPNPSVAAKTDQPAISAIYNALISQPAGTAWLVATGCLTNIALLFSIHPDLASHIAGLSIMGGALGGGFTNAPMGSIQGEGERFGNWTPWAEFNIYIDPESAKAIFDNPLLRTKTTLIPLDLTHQFLATPSVLKTLLTGADAPASAPTPALDQVSPVRRLFFEILTFFSKTYAEVFGMTEGPPTHDPLAVAVIFAPELFDDGGGERYAIDVVTEGEHGSSDHAKSVVSQCGRTIATALPAGQQGIRIPRTLDKEKIWAILQDCIAKAEKAVST